MSGEPPSPGCVHSMVSVLVVADTRVGGVGSGPTMQPVEPSARHAIVQDSAEIRNKPVPARQLGLCDSARRAGTFMRRKVLGPPPPWNRPTPKADNRANELRRRMASHRYHCGVPTLPERPVNTRCMNDPSLREKSSPTLPGILVGGMAILLTGCGEPASGPAATTTSATWRSVAGEALAAPKGRSRTPRAR